MKYVFLSVVNAFFASSPHEAQRRIRGFLFVDSKNAPCCSVFDCHHRGAHWTSSCLSPSPCFADQGYLIHPIPRRDQCANDTETSRGSVRRRGSLRLISCVCYSSKETAPSLSPGIVTKKLLRFRHLCLRSGGATFRCMSATVRPKSVSA